MEALYQLLSWPRVIGTIVVYLLSIAVYRLLFHPLAAFPGPKLAAVTRLYEGYYDLIQNGQYTFKIAELHQKYGPIVRISPFELHVSDPAFVDTLYRQDGVWHKYDWAVDAFAAYGATLMTPDHHIHKARRQPLNPFFSKAKVSAWQDRITFHVERLCARITAFAESGSRFDLGAAVAAVAKDVATEFLLGKSYDSIGADDFDANLVVATAGAGSMWRTGKFVRWFSPLLQGIPPEWMVKIADPVMAQFFRAMVVNKQDTKQLMATATSPDPNQSPNVVHEIMNSKLPPSEKAFDRIFQDIATMSGAGFETTAGVMRMVIFHTYSNSDILQRLRAELASVANPRSQIQLKALEQLPYLTAVLMEGLRLSPAIATRMARVTPDRDIVYDKWRIPRGTPVGMTTILVHTDESIYPEPNRFSPERWMNPNPWRMGDKTFLPFSKGTRNCLGMHLAWAEMYIVIATIIQRFDFKFQGVTARDLECDSDQYAIGTRGKCIMFAAASEVKA